MKIFYASPIKKKYTHVKKYMDKLDIEVAKLDKMRQIHWEIYNDHFIDTMDFSHFMATPEHGWYIHKQYAVVEKILGKLIQEQIKNTY